MVQCSPTGIDVVRSQQDVSLVGTTPYGRSDSILCKPRPAPGLDDGAWILTGCPLDFLGEDLGGVLPTARFIAMSHLTRTPPTPFSGHQVLDPAQDRDVQTKLVLQYAQRIISVT